MDQLGTEDLEDQILRTPNQLLHFDPISDSLIRVFALGLVISRLGLTADCGLQLLTFAQPAGIGFGGSPNRNKDFLLRSH